MAGYLFNFLGGAGGKAATDDEVSVKSLAKPKEAVSAKFSDTPAATPKAAVSAKFLDDEITSTGSVDMPRMTAKLVYKDAPQIPVSMPVASPKESKLSTVDEDDSSTDESDEASAVADDNPSVADAEQQPNAVITLAFNKMNIILTVPPHSGKISDGVKIDAGFFSRILPAMTPESQEMVNGVVKQISGMFQANHTLVALKARSFILKGTDIIRERTAVCIEDTEALFKRISSVQFNNERIAKILMPETSNNLRICSVNASKFFLMLYCDTAFMRRLNEDQRKKMADAVIWANYKEREEAKILNSNEAKDISGDPSIPSIYYTDPSIQKKIYSEFSNMIINNGKKGMTQAHSLCIMHTSPWIPILTISRFIYDIRTTIDNQSTKDLVIELHAKKDTRWLTTADKRLMEDQFKLAQAIPFIDREQHKELHRSITEVLEMGITMDTSKISGMIPSNILENMKAPISSLVAIATSQAQAQIGHILANRDGMRGMLKTELTNILEGVLVDTSRRLFDRATNAKIFMPLIASFAVRNLDSGLFSAQSRSYVTMFKSLGSVLSMFYAAKSFVTSADFSKHADTILDMARGSVPAADKFLDMARSSVPAVIAAARHGQETKLYFDPGAIAVGRQGQATALYFDPGAIAVGRQGQATRLYFDPGAIAAPLPLRAEYAGRRPR